ncbi:hypothetical protein V6N12_058126 [Hibiscus sabdariffa]|uniref:Uncharacterized protein n=1 Tax=Hibiscus sabdariffa TaxID=183260 RepID=A0ABR2AS32_9ROSI
MVNRGEQPSTITGFIRARDVEYLPQVARDGWTGEVTCPPRNEHTSIMLKPREYDVFAVVPVMALPSGSKLNLLP